MHSKTSRPAQQGTRLPIATLRRLRRLTATAALAVTLSGVGAVSLWTVPAHARPAPSSFAELAAEVSPAVVNVQTTYERQLVRDEGQQFGQRQGPKAAPPMPFPPNSPFGDFFRRFLDQPPDQYPSPHGPGPQGPGQQARGLGSGFLIDPEGHIVTNHHVIDGASGITVTLSDGRSFDAELIGSDPRTDLALLKAKSEEPLPHGAPPNLSGKWFDVHAYGVRASDGLLDYDEMERLVREVEPKLLIAGGSAYPRSIDFARFRKAADSVGASLLVDMAHFAGLVAAGAHESPLPHADVVTCTTTKTLRGPRGGVILSNDGALGRRIDSAVFPGLQGSVHLQVVAAKAVCFKEALQDSFRSYGTQVVANARAMGKAR